jgi:hypothetical protein
MRNDIFPIPPSEDAHADARKRIQEHPHFAAWYLSLNDESRTAFELLFLTDVTPELILFARQVPETELWQPIFLRVIRGGNPEPVERIHLTRHALLTVIADIEAFGRQSFPPPA